MMKKAISILLCICLCLSVSVFLFSCTQEDGNAPDNTPSSDEHEPDNGTGNVEPKELSKEQFATAIGSASQKCKEIVSSQMSVKSERTSRFVTLSATDSDFHDIERPDVVFASAWYMNFLKNACLNNEYTPSESFFDCYLYDKEVDDAFNSRFNMAYDEKTNNVKSIIYSNELGYSDVILMEFDINYDFENNKLLSFELFLYIGDQEFESDEIYVFRYDGTTLKQANTTSAIHLEGSASLQTILAELVAKPWADSLPDFSEEYVNGRKELFS